MTRTSGLRLARIAPLARLGAASALMLAVLTPALAGGSAAVASPGLASGGASRPAAAAGGGGWSIRPTPAPNVPTAAFAAVSCPTSTWCMAVGHYEGSQGVSRPLAERWNGATWKVVPTVAGGALGTGLLGISCSSPAACVAVGSSVRYGHPGRYQFGERPFAERWNGASWRAIVPPGFGVSGSISTQLNSVSCASATECTAVGSFGAVDQPGGRGLLETWDGRHWSRALVPAPKGTAVLLSSVSCTGANACVVVGSYARKNLPNLPFTEIRRSAHAAWADGTPPVPFPSSPAALRKGKDFDLVSRSVSCVRANACTMVGDYRHEGVGSTRFPIFTEVWDGSHWHLRPAPQPQPDSEFDSVSCWTATSCLAIGTTGNGETDTVLVERRSGSHWTVTAAPGTDPAQGDRALSCRSAGTCTVVGPTARATPLAKVSRLQGTTWSVQASPDPAGTIESTLADVSCASRNRCTAVGNFEGRAGDNPLIESSARGKWSVSTAVTPAGVFATVLTSVSCPAARFCVTVGHTFPTSTSIQASQLAESWDGTTWSAQTTPDPGTNFGSTLSQVSCASATLCVAVGNAAQNTSAPPARNLVFRQLIEWWNGSTWQIASDANPAGAKSSDLQMVSCAAASCIALGGLTSGSGRGQSRPLAERFNGHTVTQLSTSGMATTLADLSCTSPTWCMAAGTSRSGQHTLAQSWNGRRWKTLSPPNPRPSSADGGGNFLSDVSCTSRTACTAIGSAEFLIAESENTASDDHPFAERWNGKTWSIANLPVLGNTQGTSLAGISCTAARVCTAAGYITRIGAEVPTIESLRR
jgi:hypothetical protein